MYMHFLGVSSYLSIKNKPSRKKNSKNYKFIAQNQKDELP